MSLSKERGSFRVHHWKKYGAFRTSLKQSEPRSGKSGNVRSGYRSSQLCFSRSNKGCSYRSIKTPRKTSFISSLGWKQSEKVSRTSLLNRTQSSADVFCTYTSHAWVQNESCTAEKVSLRFSISRAVSSMCEESSEWT